MTNLRQLLTWAQQQGMVSHQSNETAAGNGSSGRRSSQATQLVALASNVELWHTPDFEAFATIERAGHQENWAVGAKGFRLWLAHRLYQQEGTTPSSQALQDALNVLGGKAVYEGTEYPVWTRIADDDGYMYLDLANEDWEVVEITSGGWRVISNPPVKFRRSRGMLPLPRPTAGGSVNDLRQFVNVANDNDWYLLVFWLLATFRPSGPYPVLVLHGEQGSAKSTLARVLRSLVDPNKAPLRSEPKEDARDLMIAATNGWLMVLDNLSHLSPWLSDALCRLATGGGFATRELYTDAEEVLFEAQCPVILNGIEELATRGDLLDRSILQYLPPIPEDQRRPECEFWADYDQARPGILGAILNVVGTAMQDIGTVSLNKLPMMADFALWAAAAAPALGLEPDQFVEIYHRNRDSTNGLALEVSPIVPALQNLVGQQSWEGSSTELLSALNARTDEATQLQKSWPRQPRSLSNTLRRLAPNLRATGLEVDFLRESHTRKRLVKIRKIRDS